MPTPLPDPSDTGTIATYPSARLADAAGNTLLDLGGSIEVAAPSAPIVTGSIDYGFPDVRAVTEPMPDASGEVDSTAYYGGRPVTWSGWIRGDLYAPATVYSYLDQLRAQCNPGKRYYFYFSEPGMSGERRFYVRADQFTAPLTREAAHIVAVQTTWRAPLGVMESDTLQSITLSPLLGPIGGEGGIYSPGITGTAPKTTPDYTTTSPITLAPGLSPGFAYVTQNGTELAWPVIQLYGPCYSPRIYNFTTGQQLYLGGNGGLTINAGDYVEIDPKNATIRYNSVVSDSRYSSLDFSVSQFFGLAPGINQIAFTAYSAAAGCQAVVNWRDTWL